MPAGNRHKVWAQFQKLDKVPEDFDDDPAQWVTVYTQPIAWRPTKGTEPEHADRMSGIDDATFETRWQPDISSGWRIVIDDAKFPERPTFHLVGVVDVAATRRYLTLTAKRVAPVQPLPVVAAWSWFGDRRHVWIGDSPAWWYPVIKET